MSADSESDDAYCPGCETKLDTVSVAQLEGRCSKVAVNVWTCPECHTILGTAN